MSNFCRIVILYFKIFLTWQFLLGKKWTNSENSRKNVNNKKNYQKLEIKNFKEKMLLLTSKSLKVILIIPTLNI